MASAEALISMKKRRGSEGKFPGKLHDMMQYIEEENLECIVSWELDGRGFKINDPERLVAILPMFFDLTKYRSFRRQLNMWHFQRVLEGPNKGVFIHPYFCKDNRFLCNRMSRQITPSAMMTCGSSSTGTGTTTMTTSTPPTTNYDGMMDKSCSTQLDQMKDNISKLTETIKMDLVSFDIELFKKKNKNNNDNKKQKNINININIIIIIHDDDDDKYLRTCMTVIWYYLKVEDFILSKIPAD